jgi:hypothetical protein
MLAKTADKECLVGMKAIIEAIPSEMCKNTDMLAICDKITENQQVIDSSQIMSG